jgi:hypothetical protein
MNGLRNFHNDKILVMIASYRDPELADTINDCRAKAHDPSRLRFSVVEQIAPTDAKLPWSKDVETLTIANTESKGACWARYYTNLMYRDERYVFQIDSHTRFAQDWDLTMIDLLKSAPAEKPVVSSYPPMYWRDKATHEIKFGGSEPLVIKMTKFVADGTVCFEPEAMKITTKLQRARVLAGGLLFTYGQFVREIPYDPELYFCGEEISMSIRAWTNGWDLFHPSIAPIYHHYSREGLPHHWDDAGNWGHLNARAINKVVSMLRGEKVEKCGFGTTRSLAEYEAFAGIDFKAQTIEPDTVAGVPPGTPLES